MRTVPMKQARILLRTGKREKSATRIHHSILQGFHSQVVFEDDEGNGS